MDEFESLIERLNMLSEKNGEDIDVIDDMLKTLQTIETQQEEKVTDEHIWHKINEKPIVYSVPFKKELERLTKDTTKYGIETKKAGTQTSLSVIYNGLIYPIYKHTNTVPMTLLNLDLLDCLPRMLHFIYQNESFDEVFYDKLIAKLNQSDYEQFCVNLKKIMETTKDVSECIEQINQL